MAAIDWQVIRGLYVQGITPKELAGKFGVKEGTLRSRATREKWTHVIRRNRQRAAADRDKMSQLVTDIWAERRAATRERIHAIGEKMTIHAAQLPGDELLAKADKVKTATEIAAKSVGLDTPENVNVANISILGSISPVSAGPEAFSVSDTVLNGECYRVEGADNESVGGDPGASAGFALVEGSGVEAGPEDE